MLSSRAITSPLPALSGGGCAVITYRSSAFKTLAYYGKIAIHPAPVSSLSELVTRASLGPIPGELMLLAGVVFIGGPRTCAYPMLHSLVLYGAVAVIAIAALTAQASAESDQDVAWCRGQGNPTLEQQIGGCSAVIEGGTVQGRELALSYFRRAAAYLKQQNFDSAIRDFGDGLALDPGNATAFYGRGIAYEAKKDPDRAIQDYDAAIKIDQHHVKALSNRAAIYADQRAYERALEDNNRVVELTPDQAAGYVARGLTYARRGDFEFALRDFDRAIALNAKSAIAYFNRGRVYFSKGDAERAIRDYSAAIDIGPKHASVFESRGFAYLSQGQIDKAIADYDAALQLDAKRATALYGRGTAKLKKGDTSGAEDIAAAKEIIPDIAAAFDQSGLQ
jgi:tetratricopeptide (TPR) repeat protein